MYAVNLLIALSIKHYAILTLGIHGLNCILFYICARALFAAVPQKTLLLTDDERLVLSELAEGKLQKQIDAFSPNTVTKLIKNATERNQCKTKTELLHKFIKEKIQRPVIESQKAVTESQDKSQEQSE